MKKTFKFFAALAIAAVTFASCNKNDDKKNNGNEDEEFEALIKIDGDFSDWNGVDLLADLKNVNEGWKMTNGQRVDLLKTLKIAADGVYIYLYMEVDRSQNDGGGTNWEGKELTPAFAGPLDIYIDADNNNETGAIYWTWAPFGWEYVFESATAFAETPGDLSDGVLFQFTGENQTDVWATNPPAREEVTKPGFATGAGVMGSDKVIKYECSLVRALLPEIKGNKITVGVLVQSDNWQLIGALPTSKQETGDMVAMAGVEITLPDAE